MSLCSLISKNLFKSSFFLPFKAQSLPSIRKKLSSSAYDRASPFHLAIVGSGPAGFYTAYRVLKDHQNILVDMYEALPIPFGLVRYGVAPDHPEVKNVQHRFDEVAQDSRYTFIGNVKYGEDLTLTDLKSQYDAIVFSYGSSQENSLGVRNEDEPIKNVFSARAFVGWYNGLPQYRDLDLDLTCTDTAIVIGHGNVALDVGRILLMDVMELSKTDITEYALEKLRKSQIRNVIIVGRRGPLQISFTAKELREMMNLPNTRFHTDTELIKNELSTNIDMISKDRPLKRLMQILEKGISNTTGYKSWSLKFLRSPDEFITRNDDFSRTKHVHAVRFHINRLEGPLEKRLAVPTEEMEELETGLVLKSVGYKSIPIEGLPFDTKKGIVFNNKGKIFDSNNNEQPGLYVSGWLKRGPQGVIATTMYDAFETAEVIISDIEQNKPMLSKDTFSIIKQGSKAIIPILHQRGIRTVSYEDWKKIEDRENEAGRAKHKPREKFGRIEEALHALDT